MNCRLDDVAMITKDGKHIQLEQVYLRGGQIRFVIVPDIFKFAPLFKKIRANAKNRSAGA